MRTRTRRNSPEVPSAGRCANAVGSCHASDGRRPSKQAAQPRDDGSQQQQAQSARESQRKIGLMPFWCHSRCSPPHQIERLVSSHLGLRGTQRGFSARLGGSANIAGSGAVAARSIQRRPVIGLKCGT
jgi:hypothetical protein